MRHLAAAALLILLAGVALAQPGLGTRFRLPEPASPDEKPITVSFKDTPLPDALKKLSEDTGYLFRCADELKDKTVTLEASGKTFRILLQLALQAQAAPRLAAFLVTEAQMPEQEPKFDLPEGKVTVAVKDMDTKTVLNMTATAAHLVIKATDEVLKGHDTLAVDIRDAAVLDVLTGLADKLKCKWCRGLWVEPFDPDKAWEEFSKLPADEQEKLLLQGLTGLDGLDPNAIQQGMSEGIDQLFDLPPEQRQALIERMTEQMNRFADMFGQFSPGGQQAILARLRPIIEVGIGLYLKLPANRQAELGPLVQAAGRLGFGR
jgi:hypothetical protein